MAQLLANSPAGGPVQGAGGLFALKASDSSAAGYGVVGITAAVDMLGDMRGSSPLNPGRTVAGVYGICNLPPGPSTAGVLGENTVGDGAQGVSSAEGHSGVAGLHSGGGNGVYGQSNTGRGVVGISNGAGVGVLGQSNSNDGVSGSTNSAGHSAVFGFNGARGQVPDGLNRPAGNGVWGHTTVEKGAGVTGSVDANLSQAAGVVGIGPTAGRFFGNVEVTGSLTVDRDIQVAGDLFLAGTGKDLAEQFDVEAAAPREPGTLMVIGERGTLVPCTAGYDKRAIGVVSGARTLKPAITLGQAADAESTVSIALVGTVFCRVDADKAPIEIGDLLTSSDVPGHAMKALDPARSFGAVVGKALAPLRKGRDLIPIIVALQ
jgi:hypothetical protein